MKKKIEQTEDDTYDALRRIPFDEVSARHEQYTTTIWKNEKVKHWVDSYEKRWYRRLFSVLHIKPLSFMSDVTIINLEKAKQQIIQSNSIIERDEFILDGTGWTAESYIKEIQKRVADRDFETRKKKFKHFVIIIGVFIISPLLMYGLGLLYASQFVVPGVIGLVIGITWAGIRMIDTAK